MTELIAELGRDRRSALRRWSVALLALVLLGATGVAIQQVVAHQRVAADERARAETAEREAAARRRRRSVRHSSAQPWPRPRRRRR